jgi:acyl-CoA thioesterase-1
MVRNLVVRLRSLLALERHGPHPGAVVLLLLLAACGGSADTLDDRAEVARPAERSAGDDSAAVSDAPPMDTGVVPETGARVARPGGNAADTRSVPDPAGRGVIVFLGTSLTAGYGVGEENAFPAIIQSKIDSAGLPFRVVNAGVSGETSAGGLARLDWALRSPVDVLVVELGANDGLRGLPVEQMGANLDSILVRTRRAYPDAALVIAGMEAPPNLGERYTNAFRETFADLADLREAELVPFLLTGVGGVPELNQSDGIHPTEAGHRMLAANVWEVLGPVLIERAGQIQTQAQAATAGW